MTNNNDKSSLNNKRDKTKDFEVSSIEIEGKTQKAFNGFFGMSVFCFFCGKQLGPARNNEDLKRKAEEENFKHRPHLDFQGRRWICVKCRRENRVLIDLALEKEGKN